MKSNAGSNNPFNASYLYASNNNNNTNKAKREVPATSLANFHQRAQKVEKAKVSSTPSLTGRITPLSNSYKISSVHFLGSNDKPASANSTSQVTCGDKQSTSLTQTEANSQSIVSTSSALPFLCTTTNSKDSRLHTREILKHRQSVYELPITFNQLRPSLPENPLEVRYSSGAGSVCENNGPSSVKLEDNILSPCSVFGDDENETKPDGIPHGFVLLIIFFFGTFITGKFIV